jgi:hypothetical protein
MVADVSRSGRPGAGTYSALGGPSQPDPDWLEAAGDAAKKGGSGAKSTWRGELAQAVDPAQKLSTDAGQNPIASLTNSQGFRIASTATREELLRAIAREMLSSAADFNILPAIPPLQI